MGCNIAIKIREFSLIFRESIFVFALAEYNFRRARGHKSIIREHNFKRLV